MLHSSGSKGKDKAITAIVNTTIRFGPVNVGWAPERRGADFFMILYHFGYFGPHVWIILTVTYGERNKIFMAKLTIGEFFLF